jgi:hypothetical protein
MSSKFACGNFKYLGGDTYTTNIYLNGNRCGSGGYYGCGAGMSYIPLVSPSMCYTPCCYPPTFASAAGFTFGWFAGSALDRFVSGLFHKKC